MSLIDELRELGKQIPPSHLPSDGEIKGVVGALTVLAEGGQQVFDQVKSDEEKLHNYLATGDPNKVPEAVQPQLEAQSSHVKDQEILELKQQVQNLLGVLNKTEVEQPQ